MQEHLLDTLGVRDAVFDALSSAIKESAEETAQEAGKEYAKVLAASLGTKAAESFPGSEMVQVIGGEIAKAAAGAIVGPLLTIFLKVADDTKANINRILTEPEITAAREARRFLDLKPESPEDVVLINEKLADISNAFDRAYTLVGRSPDAAARKFWIRMTQGCIAFRRGGSSVARSYFLECFGTLRKDYSEVLAERANIIKRFRSIETSIEKDIEYSYRFITEGKPEAVGEYNRKLLSEFLRKNRKPMKYESRVPTTVKGEELVQKHIQSLLNKLKDERANSIVRLTEIQKVENFILVVERLVVEPGAGAPR
jgi:hypothetical protein